MEKRRKVLAELILFLVCFLIGTNVILPIFSKEEEEPIISEGIQETINVADPVEGFNNTVFLGYEINDSVIHAWNIEDHYYFNESNGVQFTNHYEQYWSRNVLMIGYYILDQWTVLYRTDDLSGFSRSFEGVTNEYMNLTLWKDLTYASYDFRLAIRYHLGKDDKDLTVIPYIENLGPAIPYVLGFGWEMKDIQINHSVENDQIEIEGESYLLNQTLDETYTNTNGGFTLEDQVDGTQYLYLRWDRNLTHTVTVKSRTGQYNAPVTLFIRVGTLDVGQNKSTVLHWLDGEGRYIDQYNLLNIPPQFIDIDAASGVATSSVSDYLWVTNNGGDNEVYAIWKNNGTEAGGKNFDLDFAQTSRGICTDGTNFWIVNRDNDTVHKCDMDGNHQTTYTLHANNDYPQGITSDGTNIWITNYYEHGASIHGWIFKYDMNFNYQASYNTSGLYGLDVPYGITTNGDFIWLCDYTNDTIFRMDMDCNILSYQDQSFPSGMGNTERGLAVDDNYFYLVDADAVDSAIYRYDGPAHTFGNYDVEGTWTSVSWWTGGEPPDKYERTRGERMDVPEDCTLRYMQVYLRKGTGAPEEATCGVYLTAGSVLLAESNEQIIANPAGQWYNFSFTGADAISMTGGTSYEYCVYGDAPVLPSGSSHVQIAYHAAEGWAYYENANNYPTFPPFATWSTWGPTHFSLYVGYTKVSANNAPTTGSEYPTNRSHNLPVEPTIGIIVTDLDADPMTVNFYQNESGAYKHEQKNAAVGTGTNVTWPYIQAWEPDKLYYWKVTVDDGTDNSTFWFRFKTQSETIARGWMTFWNNQNFTQSKKGWFTFNNNQNFTQEKKGHFLFSNNQNYTQNKKGFFRFSNNLNFTQSDKGFFRFNNNLNYTQYSLGWFRFRNDLNWTQNKKGWFRFSHNQNYTYTDKGWFRFNNNLNFTDNKRGFFTFNNNMNFTDEKKGWFTFWNNQNFTQDKLGWFRFNNNQNFSQEKIGFFLFSNNLNFTQNSKGWFRFLNNLNWTQESKGFFRFLNNLNWTQNTKGWFRFNNNMNYSQNSKGYFLFNNNQNFTRNVNGWVIFNNNMNYTQESKGFFLFNNNLNYTQSKKGFFRFYNNLNWTQDKKGFFTFYNNLNYTQSAKGYFLFNNNLNYTRNTLGWARFNNNLNYTQEKTGWFRFLNNLNYTQNRKGYFTFSNNLNFTQSDKGWFVFNNNLNFTQDKLGYFIFRNNLNFTQDSLGWFTFSHNQNYSQETLGWFTFSNNLNYTQSNLGWFRFRNDLNYTDSKKGWVVFESYENWTTTSAGWFRFGNDRNFTQESSGWLRFNNNLNFSRDTAGWFRFSHNQNFSQERLGWFRFLNNLNFTQDKLGWFRFYNNMNYSYANRGFFLFSHNQNFSYTDRGWFRFSNDLNWTINNLGWVIFNSWANDTTACFNWNQTGNTIRLSAECSENATEYRWSVVNNDGESSWTVWGDNYNFTYSSLEEGNIVIILETRNTVGGTATSRHTFGISEPRDIIPAIEYDNRRDCERDGYYWWDDSCHNYTDPGPGDDWIEPIGPGDIDYVKNIPGGFKIPITMIMIFGIIFALLLWKRRKKDERK